jgi:hypothetical protein
MIVGEKIVLEVSTLESRVGLELLKLFMRYQMVFKILISINGSIGISFSSSYMAHEAKGVTPIPPPTSKTVSNFEKSSLALPKGPSTITRGSVALREGLYLVPITLPPAAESLSPFFLLKSQPQDLARAVVKSPLTEIWTDK